MASVSCGVRFWSFTGEYIVFINMVVEKEAVQGEGDEAKSKKALKKQAKEAEKAAKKEARKSVNVSSLVSFVIFVII